MKERKKTSANTEIWVVESSCNKKLNAEEVQNKQQQIQRSVYQDQLL
jgi:hypothetical protein